MQDKLPPEKSIVSRVLGIIAILFAHLFSLLLLLVVFVKVVPTYTLVFEQAELQLPAATVLVIRISDAVVMYWYLIILLGMTLDGLIVVLLSVLASKRTWLVSLYSHLWLLAVVFILSWTSISVVMPLAALARLNGPMVPLAP